MHPSRSNVPPAARADRPSGRTVSVIYDSSRAEWLLTAETVFPALQHWGVPHRRIDLARRPPRHWLDSGIFLLAQEHLGDVLQPFLPTLLRRVADGAGIVNLDHALAHYSEEYTSALGLAVDPAEMSVSAVLDEPSDHPIKADRLSAGLVNTRKPIPAARLKHGVNGSELLHDHAGNPLAVTAVVGSGRVAQFLLSAKAWSEDYLGFAKGLDGALWRSLVWASPGELPLLCMPPLVRHRFDDCQGLWVQATDLAFIDSFQSHRQAVTICPCLQSPDPTAIHRLVNLYNTGSVELAPHTLRPGCGLYSANGDASDAAMAEAFQAIDATGEKWGIEWSPVVSDHDHEWDTAAARYLRARGMFYRMNIALPDERWAGLHRTWYPEPFGSLDYALSPLPGELSDFFVAFNHYPAFTSARAHLRQDRFLYHRTGGFGEQKWDFLNGLVGEEGLLFGEAPVVQRLVDHMRVGLDSLFFGGSISHSHFTRDVPVKAWDSILAQALGMTGKFVPIPATHQEIAEYAKARRGIRLERADARDGRLHCELAGELNRPLLLSVYREADGHLERRFADIQPFVGRSSLEVSRGRAESRAT